MVLVGWSLGVLEALAYAHTYGDARLAALVLVDNSIGEDPPPVSDPTFLARLRRDRTATLERFVRTMYRTPRDEAYYQRLTQSALRLPLKASLALLDSSYPRSFWRQAVYRVEKPLLYAVTPRFQGQELNLKAHRPQARIEIFEQAGHALFVDEPERFNRLLEGSCNRSSRREATSGAGPGACAAAGPCAVAAAVPGVAGVDRLRDRTHTLFRHRQLVRVRLLGDLDHHGRAGRERRGLEPVQGSVRALRAAAAARHTHAADDQRRRRLLPGRGRAVQSARVPEPGPVGGPVAQHRKVLRCPVPVFFS